MANKTPIRLWMDSWKEMLKNDKEWRFVTISAGVSATAAALLVAGYISTANKYNRSLIPDIADLVGIKAAHVTPAMLLNEFETETTAHVQNTIDNRASMVVGQFKAGGIEVDEALSKRIEAAKTRGLPNVYLGYWVEGSEKMNYKARFSPLEALGPNGWERLASQSP